MMIFSEIIYGLIHLFACFLSVRFFFFFSKIPEKCVFLYADGEYRVHFLYENCTFVRDERHWKSEYRLRFSHIF